MESPSLRLSMLIWLARLASSAGGSAASKRLPLASSRATIAVFAARCGKLGAMKYLEAYHRGPCAMQGTVHSVFRHRPDAIPSVNAGRQIGAAAERANWELLIPPP